MNAEEVLAAVGRAEVTFADGRTVNLTPREGTRCLIFDRFPAGAYEVQLRLDLGQPDANGHPMLKADFFPPDSTKPDRSMKGTGPHWTPSTQSSGSRVYEWVFHEVSLRFTVGITWELSSRGESTTSVSITPCAHVAVRHADGTTD